MTNWKGIRHQVLDRIRNIAEEERARVSRSKRVKLKVKVSARIREITPQEAVVLTASIIIIIMALGGIGLIYNVFAQLAQAEDH